MLLGGTWSVWVLPATSSDPLYSHVLTFKKYVRETLDYKMPRNTVKKKGAKSSLVLLAITDIREKLH